MVLLLVLCLAAIAAVDAAPKASKPTKQTKQTKPPAGAPPQADADASNTDGPPEQASPPSHDDVKIDADVPPVQPAVPVPKESSSTQPTPTPASNDAATAPDGKTDVASEPPVDPGPVWASQSCPAESYANSTLQLFDSNSEGSKWFGTPNASLRTQQSRRTMRGDCRERCVCRERGHRPLRPCQREEDAERVRRVRQGRQRQNQRG